MRGYVSSSNWGSAGVSSENLKLYSHKIFLYAFYVRKYFYSKKKRITVVGLKVVMQIGENCPTILDLHLLI